MTLLVAAVLLAGFPAPTQHRAGAGRAQRRRHGHQRWRQRLVSQHRVCESGGGRVLGVSASLPLINPQNVRAAWPSHVVLLRLKHISFLLVLIIIFWQYLISTA